VNDSFFDAASPQFGYSPSDSISFVSPSQNAASPALPARLFGPNFPIHGLRRLRQLSGISADLQNRFPLGPPRFGMESRSSDTTAPRISALRNRTIQPRRFPRTVHYSFRQDPVTAGIPVTSGNADPKTLAAFTRAAIIKPASSTPAGSHSSPHPQPLVPAPKSTQILAHALCLVWAPSNALPVLKDSGEHRARISYGRA